MHRASLLLCFALAATAAAPPPPATITAKTAHCRALPGYFPLYYDEQAGKLFLEIPRLGAESGSGRRLLRGMPDREHIHPSGVVG